MKEVLIIKNWVTFDLAKLSVFIPRKLHKKLAIKITIFGAIQICKFHWYHSR